VFPYWLLFGLVTAGVIGSGEHRHVERRLSPMFVAIGLFIMLMVGLRYQVGTDWWAYARMFWRFEYLSFPDVFSVRGSDPAYGVLNWTVQQLGLGFWAVNLLCAALFTFGLMRLSVQQPRPWLAMLVAVPFLVIVVGMGYTRQSAALGLFMMALAALFDHRPSRSVLLILAAAAFHTSALITLPLIALSYSRNRAEAGVLLLIAVIVGYFVLLQPQWERLSYGYIEQKYSAQGAFVRLLMNVLPSLFFLLFYRRFDLELVQKRLWRNVALAAVVSFAAVFSFEDQSVILDRLSLYFVPIQLFVLSRLPGIFGRDQTSQLLLVLFVVVYCFAVQFTWLNYAVHSRFWVPYQIVLHPDAT
jgi:hypothetical protein